MFNTITAPAKSVLAAAAHNARIYATIVPVMVLEVPRRIGQAAEKAQAKLLGIDN